MSKRLAVIMVVALMASPSFGQLAGYWNFDEGSGTTAADSSGKGNPGVLQANGTGDLPVWITGHNGTGGALQFNYNTTDYTNSNRVFVDINTADAVATPGRAFTISMWVRSDMVQDWMLRVPTGDWRWLIYTNAYDFELAKEPNSDVVVDHTDYFSSDLPPSSWYQIEFPDNWEEWEQNYVGTWYHLAITCDGNFLRKYINGSQIFILPAPGDALSTATTDLYFAALDNFMGYFAGDLDEVAIWTGSYLPETEVAKLAGDTATPLTVADHAPEPPLPPRNYTVEGDLSWYLGGAKAFWSPGFNWDVWLSSNEANTVWMAGAWWFSEAAIMPGTRTAVYEWNKWYPEILNDATIYVPNTYPDTNAATHGMEWIDPSWSGRDPNTAVFAAYITPGIAICQESKWFQPYDPSPTRAVEWEDKPYWKTYARVAGVHAQGAKFRVRVYTYPTPTSDVWGPLTDPNVLTLLGEVSFPLSGVDYQWQEFRFMLPKAPTIGGSTGGNWWTTHHWFDASIVGGDANTVLYIDELSPISDRYATFYDGDLNYDGFVDYKDLKLLADEWLLGADSILEPRSGGMLINGDFYSDIGLLNMVDDYSWVSATPTGWTFTGTGDKGIQNMSKRGRMNYAASEVVAPLGASVAAYIRDNAVLEQTTAATMVAGHTYYAMAYVMTSSWTGWKDTATLTLQANDVNLASFARPLSIERWRPVYGKYTATSSDAGKPIKIKLSYANTHTVEDSNSGYMFIGYAYLSDTMPNEWPEKRQNVLANGGFDDLSAFEANYPALVQSIRSSDNWGAWFVAGVPAPTGWLYEVPAGYNLANKGGLWASGMYGSPLPTPGMSDVSIYTSKSLTLGQVAGPLAAGTKYYLDMACGINSGRYTLPLSDGNGVNWPGIAPKMFIELWRIPAGVTDGTVIYNAILAGNPSYVKVAEANAPVTGNIAGGNSDRNTYSSKWQLIGTSYTATSSDTNMYVRVRGTIVTTTADPQFAFSDVYLSTAKRQVPGGAITFNISLGMPFDILGPYDIYHDSLMNSYLADADGSGVVNFLDFAIMAEDWLKFTTFTDITGATDN